jgi:predicted nucleotidyltransferase
VLPLRLAVLFGSYARGNYTVASDIDLLLVYSGPKNEAAFALAKRTLAVPRLEPHVYTLEEYEALRPLLERMTTYGVVLWPAPDTSEKAGGSLD